MRQKLEPKVKSKYTIYLKYASIIALSTIIIFTIVFFWNNLVNIGSSTARDGVGEPEVRQALNFDGKNDHVALSNFFYDQKNIPTVTVQAWIKTADKGNQIIVSYDRSEYWRLEVNGSASHGEINWTVKTDKGFLAVSSSSRIDDGQWHQVTGVFDNGTSKLYIDGVLENTDSKGTTFGTGKKRYGFIGTGSEAKEFDGNNSPKNYFKGEIDEVRIWDKALNETEVRDGMCKELSGAQANLISYYNFNSTSGDELEDLANANDGFLKNFELNGTTSNWVKSGAAVGIESIYQYGGLTSLSLSYADSDSIMIDSIQGSVNGVQLYRIDKLTNNTNAQVGVIKLDSSRYWGVFVVGNPDSYRLKYNYGSNSNSSNPKSSNKILQRYEVNGQWLGAGCGNCENDTIQQIITKSLKAKHLELILGATEVTYDPDEPGSGYALNFNGSGDYVALYDFYSTQGFSNQLTVEAWIKTSANSKGIIIDFDRKEYFSLFVNGNGQIGFSTTDSGGKTKNLYSGTLINDGEWHHIAGVYDGEDKRIYIDGKESNFDLNPHGGKALGSGETRYGFIGDGSKTSSFNGKRYKDYFNGSIDEVRIWHKAKTFEEINQQLCLKLEGSETNLQSYYSFDESSSTVVLDKTCGGAGKLNGDLENSGWITSGAALGDNATYIANANSHTYQFGECGQLEVLVMSGIADRIYIYHIGEYPNDMTLPPECEEFEDFYWGVKVIGLGSPIYTLTYDYSDYTGSFDTDKLMLYNRNNNAQNWGDLVAEHVEGTNQLVVTNLSGSEYIVGESSGSTLPVSLVKFTAESSNNGVNIRWSTSTELNNDFFTIERSVNANDYEVIGIEKGAGNSNSRLDYSFKDQEPILGRSFYRLKQTDYDGQFEYFGPVAVNYYSDERKTQEIELSVYPNPSLNEPINIKVEGLLANQQYKVLMVNFMGNTFYNNDHIAEGKSTITIDSQPLDAGNYIVIVKAGQDQKSRQVIIKK